MMTIRVLKLFSVSILVCVSCIAPEYSDKYVSVDESEFAQYKEEASERPSPPNRSAILLGKTKVFITYSQPGVKNRVIWGDLVDYDQIWRTGANEATVLSATDDILVEGDTIQAGNYALFTIPSKDQWTVILNRKYDVWGAYDYDQSLDVLRFQVTPKKLEEHQERMQFAIDESGRVNFSWDQLGFEFMIRPV